VFSVPSALSPQWWRRKHPSAMVYVDWEALGICKFHALKRVTCFSGDECRWAHPPYEEIDRIWEEHEGGQVTGRDEAAGRSHVSADQPALHQTGHPQPPWRCEGPRESSQYDDAREWEMSSPNRPGILYADRQSLHQYTSRAGYYGEHVFHEPQVHPDRMAWHDGRAPSSGMGRTDVPSYRVSTDGA
jgi:hypothetical protein